MFIEVPITAHDGQQITDHAYVVLLLPGAEIASVEITGPFSNLGAARRHASAFDGVPETIYLIPLWPGHEDETIEVKVR